MTTSRHRRFAPSRHNRPAVVVAVSTLAVVVAVAVATVATRPSEATDATRMPPDTALTAAQSAQRGTDRADRGGERTALPTTSTSASAGVPTKSPTPVTAEPTTTSAAPVKSAAKRPVPMPAVVGHRFATAALKVRATASTSAIVRTVVPRGTRLGITGATDSAWAQTVVDGRTAWVTKAYLSTSPPKAVKTSSRSAAADATTTSGFSTAPCASGSSMESGLTANTVGVHRAACANFPSVRRFGGIGPSGEHAAGRAIDIMVSGAALGDAISAWARANAGALHISEVIWSQHIWTVQRSSEGWRAMPDRGSPTANHYDHVHVTVY